MTFIVIAMPKQTRKMRKKKKKKRKRKRDYFNHHHNYQPPTLMGEWPRRLILLHPSCPGVSLLLLPTVVVSAAIFPPTSKDPPMPNSE